MSEETFEEKLEEFVGRTAPSTAPTPLAAWIRVAETAINNIGMIGDAPEANYWLVPDKEGKE